MTNEQEIRIWKYLDGNMNQADMELLEKEIAADGRLQIEFTEIERLHKSLDSALKIKAPLDMRTNVMNKLRTEESLINQNIKVLFGVLFFVLLSSVLSVIVFADRLHLSAEWSGTFSHVISLISSPLIVGLTTVTLLTLLVDTYLVKPSVPR